MVSFAKRTPTSFSPKSNHSTTPPTKKRKFEQIEQHETAEEDRELDASPKDKAPHEDDSPTPTPKPVCNPNLTTNICSSFQTLEHPMSPQPKVRKIEPNFITSSPKSVKTHTFNPDRSSSGKFLDPTCDLQQLGAPLISDNFCRLDPLTSLLSFHRFFLLSPARNSRLHRNPLQIACLKQAANPATSPSLTPLCTRQKRLQKTCCHPPSKCRRLSAGLKVSSL